MLQQADRCARTRGRSWPCNQITYRRGGALDITRSTIVEAMITYPPHPEDVFPNSRTPGASRPQRVPWRVEAASAALKQCRPSPEEVPGRSSARWFRLGLRYMGGMLDANHRTVSSSCTNRYTNPDYVAWRAEEWYPLSCEDSGVPGETDRRSGAAHHEPERSPRRANSGRRASIWSAGSPRPAAPTPSTEGTVARRLGDADDPALVDPFPALPMARTAAGSRSGRSLRGSRGRFRANTMTAAGQKPFRGAGTTRSSCVSTRFDDLSERAS